jgi:hypothetical protein
VVRTVEVGPVDKPSARFVTLRDEHNAHTLAFCLRLRPDDIPVGSTVSVEGVIVHTGTVASETKDTVKGIFIQTSGNVCGV